MEMDMISGASRLCHCSITASSLGYSRIPELVSYHLILTRGEPNSLTRYHVPMNRTIFIFNLGYKAAPGNSVKPNFGRHGT